MSNPINECEMEQFDEVAVASYPARCGHSSIQGNKLPAVIKMFNLGELLKDLCLADDADAIFCHKIRRYAGRYDDEGILKYIDNLREREK